MTSQKTLITSQNQWSEGKSCNFCGVKATAGVKYTNKIRNIVIFMKITENRKLIFTFFLGKSGDRLQMIGYHVKEIFFCKYFSANIFLPKHF